AVLTGTPGAFNLERRLEGLKRALAAHPAISIAQVVSCNDQVDKAVALIQSVTAAQPDLAGWAFVGGWPLFGKGALKPLGAPGRVKVVTFDALPEMWPYLESGEVQVMLAQKYFEWGSESVKILSGLRHGETFPSIVDSGADVVTRDGLDDYKTKWKEKAK